MLAVQTKDTAAPVQDAPPDASLDWKHLIGPAEPFLQAVGVRLREQIGEFDPEIAEYAEYALVAQGKQLRPALVALSAAAAGEINDSHVTAAVIVEMVHLATLVHDDVIDEASIRRSKPTLTANWGNEVSVLLGDCLFAHALKLAASFPTTEVCRAVSAATKAVCTGEILQTHQRKNFELSQAQYFKVLQMKTGELFAVSCDLGAYLSNHDGAHRGPLRQYGLALGTAYQVYDDCLDLFGSESAVGKSLGTDLATGKPTLPLLLLLERLQGAERAALKRMVENWKPKHLPQLMSWLQTHQALAASRAAVQPLLNTARQALQNLPESESRTRLATLTGYLSQRIDELRERS